MVISIMRKKKNVMGIDYSKSYRSDDLPTTQGLVNQVKLELKADITTLSLEMKAKIADIHGQFHRMEALIQGMRSDVAAMRADIEKQRNENRYSLDAISLFIERYGGLEQRISELESPAN